MAPSDFNPTHSPTEAPSEEPLNINVFDEVVGALLASQDGFTNNLFLYQTPSLTFEPSTLYTFSGFMDALLIMSMGGYNGKSFYLGENNKRDGQIYGLVNIAAFLGQAMKESIQYNACDENSVRKVEWMFYLWFQSHLIPSFTSFVSGTWSGANTRFRMPAVSLVKFIRTIIVQRRRPTWNARWTPTWRLRPSQTPNGGAPQDL